MWRGKGTKAKCKGGSFRIFGMSDSGFCSDIVAQTSGMSTNCTAVLTIKGGSKIDIDSSTILFFARSIGCLCKFHKRRR